MAKEYEYLSLLGNAMLLLQSYLVFTPSNVVRQRTPVKQSTDAQRYDR
ncbi:MAG: hypothetical protein MUC61_03825 [Amoebophilaceae bacterium]|nr:hypothetical protein [Amoebophilaceae bacterium]